MLIHFRMPDFEILKNNGSGDPYVLTSKMAELIMASLVRQVSDVDVDPESGQYHLKISGKLEIPPAKGFWSDWSDIGSGGQGEACGDLAGP